MQVDWLTVAAQIVNFLVLVWLLHRFLYGPITRAMARREERIAARFSSADAARAEAEAEAGRLRAQKTDLERRREEILAAAEAEAEERRATLAARLEAEMEERRAAWIAELEQERASFLRDLRRRTVGHIHALARAALGDLADVGLEAQLVRRFLAKLDETGEDELAGLAAAARDDGAAVTVETAFDLPAAERDALAEALRARLGAGAEIRFARDEGLLLGLRARVGGQVLEWGLSAHLRRLESAVEAELDEAPGARAAA